MGGVGVGGVTGVNPPSAPARPSVILVREWEMQMSSSGCCGRLEGDFLAPAGERCFPERRETMEAMGPLYRELRERHGEEIDLNVVDPRNLVTLFGLLVRDFRDHRPGLRDALGTLFRMSVTCVIVNGRLVARGRWPAPEEVERAFGTAVPRAGVSGPSAPEVGRGIGSRGGR
jgi:hypothetical protein